MYFALKFFNDQNHENCKKQATFQLDYLKNKNKKGIEEEDDDDDG